MPVYNDWDAAEELVLQLVKEMSARRESVAIVLVDDGSTPESKHFRPKPGPGPAAEIIILNLRRNMGHQRALAIGLAWINEHVRCRLIVVMDADGEDRPEDVPRLLDAFEQSGATVVFAERYRRAEGLIFRIFYVLYRALHRILTGVSVRAGNFSVLSSDHLATLVAVSDLWNHYAAAVFRSRLPYRMLRTSRGRRIKGKSHMNFVSLVTHGLSAVSVFGETVGVRLLIGAAAASFLLIVALAAVVIVRLTTTLAIPGWATSAAGPLILALMSVITVSILLTLMVLASRNTMSFLPLRDYSWFVKSWERPIK